MNKIELLSTLIRVLDTQDADAAALRAERDARLATDESVLAAVSTGEHTWERLHAFFPECEWTALAAALTRLQRAEKLHLTEWLDFVVGARKARWAV